MSDLPEKPERVTSEELSPLSVTVCWLGSLGSLGAGITATFVVGTGAAPSTLIAVGGLLFLLALMRRIPLSLEFGGAKFDASYAHRAGLREGVDVAIQEVEEAEELGQSAPERLRELQDTIDALDQASRRQSDDQAQRLRNRAVHKPTPEFNDLIDRLRAGEHVGPGPQADSRDLAGLYTAPVACNAAGVTFRQLDYWVRTGLVEVNVPLSNAAIGLFGKGEIVRVRLIKGLLNAGVALTEIRQVVARLRGTSVEAMSGMTLLSDGSSILETANRQEALEFLESGEGFFGIALGQVVREVEAALANLPDARSASGEPPRPA